MFEFLFKYRPVVFERGEFAFGLPWPVFVFAALAAAILVPTGLMYLGVRGKSRPWERIGLSIARTLLIIVLLFSVFRPSLIVSTVVPQRNFIGVLLDDSRSMRIQDVDDTPRGEFVLNQFDPEEGEMLAALSDRFIVRLFRFSSAPERVDDVTGLTFTGGKTDLGTALDHARQELASVPLAGLVVVTDGADNSDASLTEPLLALQAQSIPVHTVGLGRSSFSRDISLTRVETPRSVLKGTSLAVDLIVTQTGYGGRTVPLFVEDDGRIVSSQDVELGRDGEAVPVRVHFTVAEPGPRVFRFRIPEQTGEMVEQNNEQEALIVVQDRTERVLYFEGEPRFEIKFIRRALQDDDNIEVVSLTRTAENKFYRMGLSDEEELVSGFPKTREELFQYRALILGSVEASFFTHDQLVMIADFVSQRGGGLLLLGGHRSFAEGGYIGTPLEDVMPVVLDPAGGGGEGLFFDEVTVEVTPAGRGHPATQIAETEAASENRWGELPAVTTLNPITSVKPGATTLLRGRGANMTDPYVVLAAQRYGRGRAVALPIQDSWVWQFHADVPLEDQSHETFWRQLIRWLVSSVPERASVNAPADRVAPGERVTLIANVEDDTYLKVNNTDVTVHITSPTGLEESLRMDWTVDRDGEYEATFRPDEEGLYELRVEAREGGEFLSSSASYVKASELAREFHGAELQEATLRRIAEETGGAYYTPATVSALPDDIRYTESGVTVVEQHDLWNMPIIFFIVLTLASGEWGYRRWRALV